ncbi:inositol monophosphatase family protein [Paenibacillus elgii]|uniref:inositol monophosphatase family protein n=1 Tax=Paenibacillus elgii TaxID=189691 RepID=UPI00398B0E78
MLRKCKIRADMCMIASPFLSASLYGLSPFSLPIPPADGLDGYYEFGDEIYNWIAGALLVQEAGGVVSDRHGNSFTWGTSGIIASNPILHQNMKEELGAIFS